MAELDFDFDPNEVEPSQLLEPLPAGEYQAIIERSEVKPTKAGTGTVLELRLKIVSGPFEGRFVRDWLNIRNPSAEAQRISLERLSSICRACGVMHAISDSEELHDRLMTVHLKLEKDKEGNPQNRVTGYTAPHDGAKPTSASNGADTVGAGVKPVAKPTAPWKKKAKAAEADAPFEATV